MKNIIYIAILVLMLSCNKKAEDVTISTSTKEQVDSSGDTLTKTNTNLDSISNTNKELKTSSDSTSVVSNDVLEINKELNGVWYPINMGVNGKSDEIMKDYIYIFDSEKHTFDIYDNKEYWENYSYKCIATDCENKKKSGIYYLKVNGDEGDYCSKIFALKKTNKKTYLLIESPIANRAMTNFLKFSNDPKNFPKGFLINN